MFGTPGTQNSRPHHPITYTSF